MTHGYEVMILTRDIFPSLWRSVILFMIIVIPQLAWAQQRSVLLITIDTLRADYLSCNGSKQVQTPVLDSLAKRGVNFVRTRSAVPLTLPSHASTSTTIRFPIWLNDSRRLIFHDGNKVFLIDRETKKFHPIKIDDSKSDITYVRISKDNKTLYFVRGTAEADIWLLTMN